MQAAVSRGVRALLVYVIANTLGRIGPRTLAPFCQAVAAATVDGNVDAIVDRLSTLRAALLTAPDARLELWRADADAMYDGLYVVNDDRAVTAVMCFCWQFALHARAHRLRLPGRAYEVCVVVAARATSEESRAAANGAMATLFSDLTIAAVVSGRLLRAALQTQLRLAVSDAARTAALQLVCVCSTWSVLAGTRVVDRALLESVVDRVEGHIDAHADALMTVVYNHLVVDSHVADVEPLADRIVRVALRALANAGNQRDRAYRVLSALACVSRIDEDHLRALREQWLATLNGDFEGTTFACVRMMRAYVDRMPRVRDTVGTPEMRDACMYASAVCRTSKSLCALYRMVHAVTVASDEACAVFAWVPFYDCMARALVRHPGCTRLLRACVDVCVALSRCGTMRSELLRDFFSAVMHPPLDEALCARIRTVLCVVEPPQMDADADPALDGLLDRADACWSACFAGAPDDNVTRQVRCGTCANTFLRACCTSTGALPLLACAVGGLQCDGRLCRKCYAGVEDALCPWCRRGLDYREQRKRVEELCNMRLPVLGGLGVPSTLRELCIAALAPGTTPP